MRHAALRVCFTTSMYRAPCGGGDDEEEFGRGRLGSRMRMFFELAFVLRCYETNAIFFILFAFFKHLEKNFRAHRTQHDSHRRSSVGG